MALGTWLYGKEATYLETAAQSSLVACRNVKSTKGTVHFIFSRDEGRHWTQEDSYKTHIHQSA